MLLMQYVLMARTDCFRPQTTEPASIAGARALLQGLMVEVHRHSRWYWGSPRPRAVVGAYVCAYQRSHHIDHARSSNRIA